MPKDDLQKVTLNLYFGDYARLQSLFPDQGAGPIIREIVHEFLGKVDAKTRGAKVKEGVRI